MYAVYLYISSYIDDYMNYTTLVTHTHALTHTPRPWPPEELQRFQPEEEVTFTSGSSMFRFLTKGRPCEALDTNISFKQNESSKTNSTAFENKQTTQSAKSPPEGTNNKTSKTLYTCFPPVFFFPNSVMCLTLRSQRLPSVFHPLLDSGWRRASFGPRWPVWHKSKVKVIWGVQPGAPFVQKLVKVW